MILRKLSTIWLILLWGIQALAQSPYDSLHGVWRNPELNDTVRMDALSDLIMQQYLFTDLDTAQQLAIELTDFARDKNETYVGWGIQLQAITYSEQGNLVKALELFEKALEMYTALGRKDRIPRVTSNIARTHGYLGNISLSARYYSEAMDMAQRNGDKDFVALTRNNIGLLYLDQRDYNKAKQYFLESLVHCRSAGLLMGGGHAHSNLALIYAYEQKADSVFYHVAEATEMYRQLGDSMSIATVLARKGILLQEIGRYDEALTTFEQVLSASEAYGNRQITASAIDQIASLYLEMGNYKKALDYANRGLVLAQELQSLHHRQGCYNLLYRAYEALGNHELALENYVQTQALLDSILKAENQVELIHQEYRYTYLKKAVADSVRNEEERKVAAAIIDKERAENAQYRSRQIMLFGGIGILLVFLAVVYNRFLVTRRQKQVIERQKVEIEEAAKTRLELEQLKQERLRADLTNAAQEITRRQEWLEQFKEKLSKVKSMDGKTQELNEVFIDIAGQMQRDSRTQELYKNIDKVNQEFFQRLKERFPKVTQNEQELSGLIRLNLATKEIASIRNVEPHSIRIARSRLRKKLGLEKEDSLEDFLQRI